MYVQVGFETEGYESIPETTGPLVLGRVVAIEELTEFKKPIRYCQVLVGPDQVQNIICGAQNFSVGDIVVVENPGSKATPSHNHHVALHRTYKVQDSPAKSSCNNLWNTDGSVEQTKVGSHVSVAFQRIRYEGKRHSQNGSPGATNKQEREEHNVLVVNKRSHNKSNATQQEREAIRKLTVLEHRQHHSPEHRAYCLHSKQYSYPVAGFLIV